MLEVVMLGCDDDTEKGAVALRCFTDSIRGWLCESPPFLPRLGGKQDIPSEVMLGSELVQVVVNLGYSY